MGAYKPTWNYSLTIEVPKIEGNSVDNIFSYYIVTLRLIVIEDETW